MARLLKRLLSCFGWYSAEADDRRGLGARGETMAVRHLRRRGYRVLERNFRAAGAEIDLIAMDGSTLVFVEVKARRSVLAGVPQEAVDYRKQQRIRRAASVFAARRALSGRPMRFDVIAISRRERNWQFELIKDAF